MSGSHYSHGNVCRLCDEPIANGSRQCREHARVFFLWLFRIYGYKPKLGKRPSPASKAEIARQAILDVLAEGPFSTPELARATGGTVEGTRYACKILLDRGQVEKMDDGYRHIWTLADAQCYDNVPGGY